MRYFQIFPFTFLLVLSTVQQSFGQKQTFKNYVDANKADLVKTMTIDSMQEEMQLQKWSFETALRETSYYMSMNMELLDLIAKIDKQGISAVYEGRTEIKTKQGWEASQIIVEVDEMVNLRELSIVLKGEELEQRFPDFWKLVKDSTVVFETGQHIYFAPLMTESGGLNLPAVPPHMLRTGNEASFKSWAERYMDYISEYNMRYGCDRQLIREYEDYENKLTPKSWKSRFTTRRIFIQYLHQECRITASRF